ncbi:flavin reductase family protein [Amycolatopsis sp. EV170708-02-1]|uniref:flavin reductase family protein n=1 Tax=Amycolatopsis sp. EV170708-02-1 TaxID=2919322 RepID=UPI001F0CB042|nr:flavin reductase family protein [Amycolatopsis sp. EV170708-02-1]UMP03424.1 flavin reductase family protein [Amycolatopsis sp. EV170708-02-1]
MTGDLRALFTDVMAAVPTPVSVVTAMDGDRPHGTTVSAFASLSLEPPMVLVALDQRSDLLKVVRATRRFGLNVLAGTQSPLAMAFARKGETKFEGVAWHRADDLPLLDGVSGWLACDVSDLTDGGDHVVALGSVVAAHLGDAVPLTYHARTFGTPVALDGATR